MTLEDNRDDNYSEGYCKKCNAPLDISGTCYVCIFDKMDDKSWFNALADVTTDIVNTTRDVEVTLKQLTKYDLLDLYQCDYAHPQFAHSGNVPQAQLHLVKLGLLKRQMIHSGRNPEYGLIITDFGKQVLALAREQGLIST